MFSQKFSFKQAIQDKSVAARNKFHKKHSRKVKSKSSRQASLPTLRGTSVGASSKQTLSPKSRHSRGRRSRRARSGRKYAKGYVKAVTEHQAAHHNIEKDMHPNYDSDRLLDILRIALNSRSVGHQGSMRMKWRYLNKDGQGGIDFNEFMEVLHDLNLYFSTEKARVVFDIIDTDKNGVLCWKEFATHLEQPCFSKDNLLTKLGGYEEQTELEAALKQQQTKGRASRRSSGYSSWNSSGTTTPGRSRKKKPSLRYMGSFVEKSTPVVDPRLHKGFNGDDILGDIRRALQAKCRGTSERRTYWRFFNRNGRGGVDMEEFVEAMHDLNLFYPREEVEKTFREVDADGNGTIDWMEFNAHFYQPDFTDEGRLSILKVGENKDVAASRPFSALFPGSKPRRKVEGASVSLNAPTRRRTRRSKSADSLRRPNRRPGARGKCTPLYTPWASRNNHWD